MASPSHVWIGIFALWALLLSGTLAGVIGSPGALQLVRLRALLHSKQAQIVELENGIERLETERLRIEKSRFAQEREIRRVLGYAATDELIFDFTTASGKLGGRAAGARDRLEMPLGAAPRAGAK